MGTFRGCCQGEEDKNLRIWFPLEPCAKKSQSLWASGSSSVKCAAETIREGRRVGVGSGDAWLASGIKGPHKTK